MAKYYYSTQPFLAWCLNHYFYNQQHFAWIGTPFYPYRLPNPRSSNPLRLYEDLYEPWKDQDEFRGYLANIRLRLRKGVLAYSHRLQSGVEPRLLNICDRIDLVFFYPIVYRVNIDTIASSLLIIAGSGSAGSNEYRIDTLDENEFDILFVDFESENVPKSFEDFWSGTISQADVLSVLETWLV